MENSATAVVSWSVGMEWHWLGGELPQSIAPKPRILTLSLGSAPLK